MTWLLRHLPLKATNAWKNSDRFQKIGAVRLAGSGAFAGIVLVGALCWLLGIREHQVYQFIGAAGGFALVVGFKLLHVV